MPTNDNVTKIGLMLSPETQEKMAEVVAQICELLKVIEKEVKEPVGEFASTFIPVGTTDIFEVRIKRVFQVPPSKKA